MIKTLSSSDPFSLTFFFLPWYPLSLWTPPSPSRALHFPSAASLAMLTYYVHSAPMPSPFNSLVHSLPSNHRWPFPSSTSVPHTFSFSVSVRLLSASQNFGAIAWPVALATSDRLLTVRHLRWRLSVHRSLVREASPYSNVIRPRELYAWIVPDLSDASVYTYHISCLWACHCCLISPS